MEQLRFEKLTPLFDICIVYFLISQNVRILFSPYEYFPINKCFFYINTWLVLLSRIESNWLLSG